MAAPTSEFYAHTITVIDDPVDGTGPRTAFVQVEGSQPGSPETVDPLEVTGDVDAANDQQVPQAVPDTEDANLVVGFSQP